MISYSRGDNDDLRVAVGSTGAAESKHVSKAGGNKCAPRTRGKVVD